MRVLVLTAFALTSAAFAMREGTYEGNGTWRTTSGYTGTFKETVTISKSCCGHGLKIESSSTSYDNSSRVVEQETRWARIVWTKHGFFDLMREHHKVGSGYCFGDVCHMSYEAYGKHREETLHFGHCGIQKVGSYKTGSMEAAWTGDYDCR